MNTWFRVETSTGILRSASEKFPRQLILESEYVCTILGPITPDEYNKVYKVLWPLGPSYNQKHEFAPHSVFMSFCLTCGKRDIDNIHYMELY
jgi:hypothetical protein